MHHHQVDHHRYAQSDTSLRACDCPAQRARDASTLATQVVPTLRLPHSHDGSEDKGDDFSPQMSYEGSKSGEQNHFRPSLLEKTPRFASLESPTLEHARTHAYLKRDAHTRVSPLTLDPGIMYVGCKTPTTILRASATTWTEPGSCQASTARVRTRCGGTGCGRRKRMRKTLLVVLIGG